jgi:filamentous hemagglutinin family protein
MSISVSADENKALTRRLFNRITVRFPMLFLILMSLVLTSSMQPKSAKAQEEGGGLEGTWLNDVKIVTCSPAPPAVIATFQSMITYMRGGVLIESGSPTFPTAVSRSPSHGIWKPTSGHSFHVFFRFHTFDNLGRLNSIVEVTTDPSLINGELSGNGTNKITIVNPVDGTVIGVTEGCNEATSRRFSFED